MSNDSKVILPKFEDGKEHSPTMAIAFEDIGDQAYVKKALTFALGFTLFIIWTPFPSFKGKVYEVNTEEQKPQKRKVLKPPPEKPIERIEVQEKRNKKMPMPDMTPDDPEPIVEPEPPPEPEVSFTDDWEIGIPDGPPEPVTDTIARAGMAGVEAPIFTKRVKPKFPERAAKIKYQGYVILEAILRKDGGIDEIKVLRTLGKGKFGFEEEAITALKQWKFLPGKVNGKPADVRMTLKIDFVLQ